MDLEFSAEQEALRSAVRDVLNRECPPSVVRALAETGEYPHELWKRMVELDWPLLTVPEAHGGVGYGFAELAVVAEELGRAATPSLFEAVATQFQPLLLALGQPVTPGATGTVAFFGNATVTTGTAAVVVNGTAWSVFDAVAVDEILVVANGTDSTDGDGGTAVVRVATVAPGVAIKPVRSFDPTRRLATVTFAGTPGDLLARPGPRAKNAIDAVLTGATAVTALETVGTCQTLFDLTLDYAKTREQFGVPIGSFQAIKHKLADMYVALERARATAYFAAAALAEDDTRADVAVAMAKAAAGDAQRLIAQEAIQIHGGIGFTWEHDLHLFVKRAKAGDALFGTAAHHRARVAAALLQQ